MSLDVVIELKDVCKSFGRDPVHTQLNLQVPRGLTTIIVGPSGVGKSTVLKYILGLLQPDSGQVLVNGENVSSMSRKSLQKMRSSLGVLFQGGALLDSLTVFENVALPLEEKTRMKATEIRDRVMESLRRVELHKSEHKYPAELSGGMVKRAGLARALVHDPEIVLFDEPTTGLDPETTLDIYDLFAELQSRLGYTALIVSHDIPGIFRIANQVALLKEGNVKAFLPPQEILSSMNPQVEYLAKLCRSGTL